MFFLAAKAADIEVLHDCFLNYICSPNAWVPYGKVYPFGEAFCGNRMTGGALSVDGKHRLRS